MSDIRMLRSSSPLANASLAVGFLIDDADDEEEDEDEDADDDTDSSKQRFK